MKNGILLIICFLTIVGINNKLFSQNSPIEISYKRNDDRSIDFSYEKSVPGSYTVKVMFSDLENSNGSDYEGVIKASSGRLFSLRPNDDSRSISFSYSTSVRMGIVNPKIDSLLQYSLPFLKGKKLKIVEASNLGERFFGSERPKKWKSYIINRKRPDTVCSMRKGIVIRISNEHKTDTLQKKSFTSKTNSILIEHPDGTYASYSGFKHDSIFVELGQTVYPQTKLGVLDAFNVDNYRLYFSVYYLADDDLKKYRNLNLKTQKTPHVYLTPYFITDQGVEKLKPKTKYTVAFGEETLLREFTRREKKKYKKNPELFE